MYYWIMQEIGSNLIAHGPYRSEGARDNRFEKIHGGEIHKFSCFSNDSEKAKQEFRDEQIRRLD